jgi:hypothetical protein
MTKYSAIENIRSNIRSNRKEADAYRGYADESEASAVKHRETASTYDSIADEWEAVLKKLGEKV